MRWAAAWLWLHCLVGSLLPVSPLGRAPPRAAPRRHHHHPTTMALAIEGLQVDVLAAASPLATKSVAAGVINCVGDGLSQVNAFA